MKKVRSLQFAWLILIVGLTSCSGMRTLISRLAGQPDTFLPPTQPAGAAPLLSLTPTPEPTSDLASIPTPACTNVLTFLEDLTIPDGTITHPGEALDKRWLVQNNGSCNWNDQYRLKLISGPELGVPEEQALYPARSGTQAIIRILFTTPELTGLQRSAWQAFSPQGEAFGDPFYIEVQVETPAP